MKYNININQRAVVENGLLDKVDLTDLALFDLVYGMMNNRDIPKTYISGVEYVRVSHSYVSEQSPLLGINHRDTLRKRMLKLVDAGLLNRYEHNQEENQSLYSRGPKFSIMVFSNRQSGLPTDNDTLPNLSDTCRQPSAHPADENRHNNNIIYNNTPIQSKDCLSPKGTDTPDEEFERWYNLYGKKTEKQPAWRMWKRLTKEQKKEIFERTPAYVSSTPDIKYRMNPATYINPANKRWQDEVIGKEENTKSHLWK